MGNNCCSPNNKGELMVLVFDCRSLGKFDIQCYDLDKLKKVIKDMCTRANISYDIISGIQYKYRTLDQNATVRELGIPSGGVLLVLYKDS